MVDTTATSGSLVQRMIRAAKLEPNLYEEVEADRTATTQAAIVVAITAVASGIGAALAAAQAVPDPNVPTPNPIGSLIGTVIWALLSWVVWSYLTYLIGTRLFAGRATPGEMLRAIGFATTPRILGVLVFIPVLGPLVGIAAGIWSLVAGVVAVRQGLDFTTGKAILTTIIGWAVVTLVPLLLVLLGVGAIAALIGAGRF